MARVMEGGTNRAWRGLSLLALLLLLSVTARAHGPSPNPTRASCRRGSCSRSATTPTRWRSYSKLYAETAHPTYLRNIGRCYQNLRRAPKRHLPALRSTCGRPGTSPGAARAGRGLHPRDGGAGQEAGGRAPGRRLRRWRLATAQRRRPPCRRRPGLRAAAREPRRTSWAASAWPRWASAPCSACSRSRTTGRRIRCARWTCATAWATPKNQAAVRDARISDIALGAGIVGAGVAVYLFFADGSSKPSETSSALRFHPTPRPGPRGALGRGVLVTRPRRRCRRAGGAARRDAESSAGSNAGR